MWQMIKNIIKALLPAQTLKSVRPLGHGLAAFNAHWIFGKPSDKVVVIGVTGTNGKTTTVNLIAKILQEAGHKTGYLSTATYDIGNGEQLNKYKMTTLSGWLIHKRLKQMVEHGITHVVLEISSEALAQNRHLGINFDVAVFTNLTPEHLESHGGFENYKAAKAILFQALTKHPITEAKKKIYSDLQKTIITNIDDTYGEYFLNFKAQKHITFGLTTPDATYRATNVEYSPLGLKFEIRNSKFEIHLKGQFDVYNSLAAIAATSALGVSLETTKTALEKVAVVPGRVEVLQSEPFTIVVDYAYEPEEMKQLYETVARWNPKRVIQVLGPSGGGRDHARIKVLGEMAGKFAHTVYITTDDPYDDDPNIIGKEMLTAAASAGKEHNKTIFFELDRKKAIELAIKTAQPGDLILITGKGADQKMALANGQYLDWDDREITKHILNP